MLAASARAAGGVSTMNAATTVALRLIRRSYSTIPGIPHPTLRIALIGPPGSGKGTQSNSISNDFGVLQFSTGDMLRAAAKEESSFGKKLKEQLASGGLVSDELLFPLLEQSLTSNEAKLKGWILDGYPRTLSQAKSLDKLLETSSQALSHVLFIKVDELEVAERIKGRLYHPASGRLYHVSYKPPLKPGVDDITGEPLIQREDDKPETVIARLRAYNEKTKPLLDYYDDKKLLSTIAAPTSKDGYVIIKKLLSDHIATHSSSSSSSS